MNGDADIFDFDNVEESTARESKKNDTIINNIINLSLNQNQIIKNNVETEGTEELVMPSNSNINNILLPSKGNFFKKDKKNVNNNMKNEKIIEKRPKIPIKLWVDGMIILDFDLI